MCSRFDVVPACGRQTDGQTDGIAIASTALAMRALRRAEKTVNDSKRSSSTGWCLARLLSVHSMAYESHRTAAAGRSCVVGTVCTLLSHGQWGRDGPSYCAVVSGYVNRHLSICPTTTDDIHYQMLKHLPSEVLNTLLSILNDIWLTGNFFFQLASVICGPNTKTRKRHL